ncbi:MAG: alpha/beta fold hydrolase [Chloroflexi bacterium]|nr:alpha/beta fold hydrolase [Chloroflexota bacterium]
MVSVPSAGIREHHAVVDGVSVRYVSTGQGPPVVLVHGLAGNLSFWQHNLGPLGRSFSVYALDLPGHGGSQDALEYTLPYAARLLAGLLDHLGAPRASLVGSSLGGLIALEMAQTYPDRVERLVLVDSAGLCRYIPWHLRLLTVPGLGWLLSRPTRRALRHSLNEMVYRRGEVSAERLWGHGPPWRGRALLRIVRYGADLHGLKPWFQWQDRLGLVRQPTLIVWGAEDRIFHPDHARRAHHLLPGSRLVIIPEAGHLPQWESPEAFNRAVADFLQGS